MLRLTGLLPEDTGWIQQMLTVRNARRAQQKRFSGWAANLEPEYLTGYEYMPGTGEMLVAPGAAKAIWERLTRMQRPRHFQGMLRTVSDVRLRYVGEARDYQHEVVKAMVARSNAVAVGPCGCGKTDMALRVMAGKGGKWLIVVHMRELVKQWSERIAARLESYQLEFNEPDESMREAGNARPVWTSIYSTTRKRRWNGEAEFVIATVQGLRRHSQDVVELAEEGRAIWVDECHHTPCATFTEVLALGAWRYRFGVTATPERADGTTALMHWWIGPTVATVDRGKVEASGHLLRPRLEVVTTDFRSDYDPDEPGDMQRLIQKMIDSSSRAATIVRTVLRLVAEGRHILVCVDRIGYGEYLAAVIGDLSAVPVRVCHAKLPKADRAEILSKVADGSIRVIIATSLADEGLDIPILDTVVLATPSGSATRAEQRMGRACRPLPNKPEPIIVDVVDPLVCRVDQNGITHRIFVNQFRKRYASVYRAKANHDAIEIREMLKGFRNAR